MSTTNQNELHSLIDEHRQLQTLIDEQNAWWKEVREIGIPRFWDMASQLSGLRHRLAEHFAHEERAEHEAVKAALNIVSPDKAAGMAREHSDLLQRLDAMIAKANECGGYDCWGEIGLEFSEVIHAIDEHEGEELRLLGKALGERSVAARP